ncbi:MAG: NifU family protein [Firmicutes bacterium]|nr:NifU family protein [Bacillota bacterium]
MYDRVEQALEKVRGALKAHGGNVELVSVENNVVKVRLTGACGGCPFSRMTLKNGVERVLKEEIPEIERVEAE